MKTSELLFLALLLGGLIFVASVSFTGLDGGPVMNEASKEITGKGEEFFVVYGDTRTNHSTHRQVVSVIESYSPEYIINTGDLVENGSRQRDWRYFGEITGYLKGDYYPAVGNHEAWNRGGKDNFLERFPEVPDEGYYSLKRSGIKFIFLNQYEDYSPGSKQYDWFREQLREDQEFPKIAVLHEPHFQANHHANEKTARHLVPLMEEYGVNAVFYGHTHSFGMARKNGITYVVTGGGGAPLYNPNRETLDIAFKKHHFVLMEKSGDALEASVIDKEGTIIHEFSISLEPSPAVVAS